METRHLLATIGDFVWHDLNADGIQNAGEPGIGGVVVNLRGGGANKIIGDGDDTFASTTTNASGLYSFPNLQDGQSYQVTFDLPAGFDAFSPRQVGGNAAKDSDAAVSDVVTLPVNGWIIDDFTQGAADSRPQLRGCTSHAGLHYIDHGFTRRDDRRRTGTGVPSLRRISALPRECAYL